MDAEVIQDSRWMKRSSRNVRLRQFAPESRILHQLGGRGVVGVSIFPVGSEDQARPNLAEHGRELPAVVEARFEAPVRKPQVLSPGVTQGLVGVGCLSRSSLEVSQRRGLAARQVEDPDLPSLLNEPNDRPSHAKLGIVGMW